MFEVHQVKLIPVTFTLDQ